MWEGERGGGGVRRCAAWTRPNDNSSGAEVIIVVVRIIVVMCVCVWGQVCSVDKT